MPLRDALALDDATLAAEIGAVRRDQVIADARAVHSLGDQERGKQVAKLRQSADEADRYVAALVMRWEKRG